MKFEVELLKYNTAFYNGLNVSEMKLVIIALCIVWFFKTFFTGLARPEAGMRWREK